MKKIGILLLIAVAFAGGFWISNLSVWPNFEKNSSAEASLLLEQVRKVAKLVTVEGHISEVYNYKDYYGYDWSMFRKKALIRVKAKVSAGYDLEHIQIKTNPTNKTLTINALPEVEILSIDHELDYYDLSEGTFNTFSNEDLNQLNKQAKDYILEIAKEGELMQQAAARGDEMLDMIRFLVEGAGWSLVISPQREENSSLRG